MYYRRKRIIFITVIITTSFAVFATIANIIVNDASQFIFKFFGISALLMLVLSAGFGIIALMCQVKKLWPRILKALLYARA